MAPNAVPSVWNPRYREIDENFAGIDTRVLARENEMDQARGGRGSLDERLDEMDGRIGSGGVVPRVQGGEVIFYNRGVKNGLWVSSSSASRSLDFTAGTFFIGGRLYGMGARTNGNGVSVPPNPGSTAQTCEVYLRINGDSIDFQCSPLGQSAPADAVPLWRLTIPAGNTAANDANLINVGLAYIGREEIHFPVLLRTPPSTLVSLPVPLPNANWHIDLDVVEAQGASVGPEHLIVAARASNGFRLTLAHTADAVKVRYTVTHMGV
ncbi:hypothetical protein D5039_09835 [Verminephrobacter aporrectodeae subsp. tuberculatae]|uniref:Uncharacterized protein n=3 Tax=Verminephrobacter TaxID=364316 RepID=A0ABT3KSX9_9BURK|nr:hypothetical protein [Verminephrobacter aporrectodeae subsp. tuberculatae]